MYSTCSPSMGKAEAGKPTELPFLNNSWPKLSQLIGQMNVA